MSTHPIALVTGAAARLGAATAEELHSRGCTVIIHCNSNRSGADELAGRLNTLRESSAFVYQADLSSPQGVEKLAESVRDQFGRVDILVNNASRFYPTAVGSTLAWQWDDLLNSNLRGPYFLVQALLEELKTAGGVVINIIDVHAERPMKDHAVYSISKAGLQMMTRSLAQELAPAVRVNGVSPGAILWPENEPTEQHKQEILEKVLLKRAGQASDIATAVAYLALDANYVTGQVLAVDGGRSVNM